jgi:hypothetical protein
MRHLVYCQTSFAGCEVDNKSQKASGEFMYKHKGKCIESSDKSVVLEFPTYTHKVNFIKDNNEFTNCRARKMTEQQMEEGF